MKIKKAGILYHPMVPATQAKTQQITAFLEAEGIPAWTCSAWDTEKAISLADDTDLLITTGGDGTILRAAQVAWRSEIPVLGINMGTLGFMTELSAQETPAQLSRLLAGEGWLEERAMLEAELAPGGQEGSHAGTFQALNDIVLARGAIARIIQISASIDDRPLTTYRADGVILATATGSTGYALATGGPVFYPEAREWLLAPILPHLGLSYKLVLSQASHVKLELSTTHQATLSIDGHVNIPVASGAVLKVRLSSRRTRFLRLKPPGYFYATLEEKLRRKK